MPVTNRLKEIRHQKNLNQEELALAIGSSRRNIINLERGDRNPSIEMALRLAAYLEVSVEDIFQVEE